MGVSDGPKRVARAIGLLITQRSEVQILPATEVDGVPSIAGTGFGNFTPIAPKGQDPLMCSNLSKWATRRRRTPLGNQPWPRPIRPPGQERRYSRGLPRPRCCTPTASGTQRRCWAGTAWTSLTSSRSPGSRVFWLIHLRLESGENSWFEYAKLNIRPR
jgi:hypothetical protein